MCIATWSGGEKVIFNFSAETLNVEICLAESPNEIFATEKSTWKDSSGDRISSALPARTHVSPAISRLGVSIGAGLGPAE